MSAPTLVFKLLGDCALLVEVEAPISTTLSARLGQLQGQLKAACQQGQLPGIIDMTPAYRTLVIAYDPQIISVARLQEQVQQLWQQLNDTVVKPRHWQLPVCYHPDFGYDLELVSSLTGLSVAEVIERHSHRFYHVYMLGFLPGFAYLGDIDEQLQLPRLAEPRLRVPAGSVSIAGGQTAIYPWESPGGWYLLGRCPVPLFDPLLSSPCLFQQGDQVCFKSISYEAYLLLEDELRQGRDLNQFLCHESLL